MWNGWHMLQVSDCSAQEESDFNSYWDQAPLEVSYMEEASSRSLVASLTETELAMTCLHQKSPGQVWRSSLSLCQICHCSSREEQEGMWQHCHDQLGGWWHNQVTIFWQAARVIQPCALEGKTPFSSREQSRWNDWLGASVKLWDLGQVQLYLLS